MSTTSNVSFSPDSGGSSAAAANDQSYELAAQESQLPVTGSYFAGNDRIQGEYSDRDLQIPRFSLVQGVGPLSENFTPGHFVYNKGHSLGTGPIDITILSLKKYFCEDIPYGSEVFPRIVNALEEIRKLGGAPSWEKPKGMTKEDAAKRLFFKPVLDIHALVAINPESEAAGEAFHEFEGQPYVEAVWTVQSTAYTRVARPVITAAQLALKNGLHTRPWSVTAKREKVGPNLVWVPKAVLSKPHSPEFVAWVNESVLFKG